MRQERVSSAYGPELWLFQRGRVRPLRPYISDINLFCDRESAVDVNPEIPHGALDFRMTQ